MSDSRQDLDQGASPAASTSVPPGGRGPRSGALELRIADSTDGREDREPAAVRVADPDRTTVAELARALELTAAGPGSVDPAQVGLCLDGRHVPGKTPVSRSGIVDGVSVAPGGADGPRPPICLVAVGGPDAGRHWPLPDGSHRIGRSWPCAVRLTDPHTAEVHAVIRVVGDEVSVFDLGSTNRTSVDGIPVAGSTPLAPGSTLVVGATLAQLAARARPAVATVPPHIVATPHPVPDPAPGPPPGPPPSEPVPGPRPTLSIAGLVAPLAVGAVLALVYGPLMALLTAMGPVIILGSWMEARRRHRRSTKEAMESVARAGEAHEAEITRRARASNAAQQAVAGTAATFSARAATGRDGFWARTDIAAVVGWTDLDAGGKPDLVDLQDSSILIVGPRATTLQVTRHLMCQLATVVPPSQLQIELDVDDPDEHDWGWVRWLPHGRPTPGSGARDRLVIIDRAAPIAAPPAQGAIVLRGAADELPPWCARIVESAPGGAAAEPAPVGLDHDHAARVARLMARWRDPRIAAPGPQHVDLGGLLGGTTTERWASARSPAVVAAPIGRSATGTVTVDLVSDGPHALIAGTTGSGKSELLRALVVGLAACSPPSDLAFVLIDYKGGAAFDGCAGLPHVAGIVTDLDEGMLRRALAGLTAEVDRRERWLRAGGWSDLNEPPRTDDRPPRLVVIVDEFAALAKAEGDHLGTLVDLARRGRSLGLHLVLATQRPSGVVNDEIRANTDLRIALRLVDAADSTDLVGVPDAARLPGDQPGSALLSVAGSPPVAFQVADLSTPTSSDGDIEVGVRSVPAGPSRLTQLVDEATTAARRLGLEDARCPWPPPLPTRLEPDELDSDPAGVVIGRDDDIPGQRHGRVAWAPGAGPLCLHGGRTSDLAATSTGAVAALLGQSRRDCIYVIDGDGALDALSAAAPVVAVVGASDPVEDLHRLLHRVSTTANERLVLVVHRLDLLMSALDDAEGLRALDRLVTTAVTIGDRQAAVVITTTRRSALPPGLRTTGSLHVALHPIDDHEALLAGLPPGRRIGDPPGRGTADDGRVLQLCTLPPDRLGSVAAATRPSAPPLLPLPEEVTVEGLPEGALGLADPGREPVAVILAPGDRFVVTGPPRSGRTTTLRRLARRARDGGEPVLVITPRPSEWVDFPDAVLGVGDLPTEPSGVLVVDDGASVDDVSGRLEDIARGAVGRVTLIVAMDPVEWARTHGHWTRRLAPGRSGIALDHRAESEDTLWAIRLPPTPVEATPPGRGVLITGGEVRPVQVGRE